MNIYEFDAFTIHTGNYSDENSTGSSLIWISMSVDASDRNYIFIAN